jgi:hypothetical protein
MEIVLCQNCKHYFGDLKCSAFPLEIPQEILLGENNHLTPLDEQIDDTVFEPIKQ